MPFVQRVVEPRDLSKTSLKDERGRNLVEDDELQAVANNTLSNALRQLASLVLAATDVFAELTVQLDDVGERSKALKTRMDAIEVAVRGYDPKKVPVRKWKKYIYTLLFGFVVAKVVINTLTLYGQSGSAMSIFN
ncbi:wiskott-Aldrich syndrome protein family member 3-like [Ctenocephalides felis]|uniref:wiskott-Aldrich syndrome protein family member 3-like n=1 Tax=Ctenocephalides felis TaxID=7515 RepID=UPI000E6E3722|nr:wiskott-Aldrich syndrome protein family member 3-like [Ctenocephalides felis]